MSAHSVTMLSNWSSNSVAGDQLLNTVFPGSLEIDESPASINTAAKRLYEQLNAAKREIRLLKYANNTKPGKVRKCWTEGFCSAT